MSHNTATLEPRSRATKGRNPNLLTVSEAAQFCGVSPATMRNYAASGSIEVLRIGTAGHRRFDVQKLRAFRDGEEIATGKGANKVAIYCRVSSAKQSSDRKKEKTGDSDLSRQIARMTNEAQTRYPERELTIYEDTGSALNFDRKSFVTLYRDILSGSLSGAVILIENRDRLCRLAARLVELACEYHDVQIIYTSQENKTDSEMLVADLISITTYFAMSMYGNRSKLTNTKGVDAATTIRGKELLDGGKSLNETVAILQSEGHTASNGDKLTTWQVRQYIFGPRHQLDAVISKGPNSAEEYVKSMIVVGEPSDRLSTALIYQDYLEWAKEHGFQTVNKFKFALLFKNYSCGNLWDAEKKTAGKCYIGVRIRGKKLHHTVKLYKHPTESGTDTFLRFYSTQLKGRKLAGSAIMERYRAYAKDAANGSEPEVLERRAVYGLLKTMGARFRKTDGSNYVFTIPQ